MWSLARKISWLWYTLSNKPIVKMQKVCSRMWNHFGRHCNEGLDLKCSKFSPTFPRLAAEKFKVVPPWYLLAVILRCWRSRRHSHPLPNDFRMHWKCDSLLDQVIRVISPSFPQTEGSACVAGSRSTSLVVLIWQSARLTLVWLYELS